VGRLPKVLIGVAASLLAVVVLLIIAANLWLQSSEVQARLRQAVLEATGLPVKVQTTYFTPWGGVSLRGIQIVDSRSDSSDFLHIDGIQLRIKILPLLRKSLVVQEVVLREPRLTWQQTEDGIWEVPRERNAPAEAEAAASPPQPSAPANPEIPELTLDEAPQTTTAKAPEAASGSSFQVAVERLRTENGSLAILNRSGDRIVELRGLDLDSDVTGMDVAGTLTAEELHLGQNLSVEGIEGAYSLADNVLTFQPLTGKLAGGKATAVVRLLPAIPDIPFKATLTISDASIRELLQDASLPAEDSAGTVSGDFELRGEALNDKTFKGLGSLRADDARFEPIKFLAQLGELLRVDELQLLELHDADASFSIADQKILVDSVNLRTENILIRAAGPVSFKGDLDLDGLMVVNEKLQNDLRGLLGSNFEASEEFPGSKQLEFAVGGTVSRPTTDLIEKITGFRIRGEMGGLLRQFLQVIPQAPSSSPESSDP